MKKGKWFLFLLSFLIFATSMFAATAYADETGTTSDARIDHSISANTTNNSEANTSLENGSQKSVSTLQSKDQYASVQGREISDHISSLSLDDCTVHSDGDIVNLKATFNDSLGKIHSGDFIQVNLPNHGHYYAEGFIGTKDLLVNGKNVGRYDVNAQQIKLVFKDDIESLEKVNGDFSFAVRVRNFSNADQQIPIQTGSHFVAIKVKGQNGSSSASDIIKQEWSVEKVGSLRSDKLGKYIFWGLYLNKYRAQLSGKVVVDDPINPGMTLDPDSLLWSIDEGRSWKSFAQLLPDSSYSTASNTLRLEIAASDLSGKMLTVGFKTRVIDDSLPCFENSAITIARLKDEKKDVKEPACCSVKNRYWDVHVYGSLPNQLKIVKKYTESDGSVKVLPGVTFSITGPEGKTFNATTDSQGMVVIPKLAKGTYFVKEISAPSFIDLSTVKDNIWTVNITDQNGQALIIFNQKAKPIPWASLTPAKKVQPWQPLTPAKKTQLWVPLTPAKKVQPWQPLTPAKKTQSWAPLTPTKPSKPLEVKNEVSPKGRQPLPDISKVTPKTDIPDKGELNGNSPVEDELQVKPPVVTDNGDLELPHLNNSHQSNDSMEQLPQTGNGHEFWAAKLVLLINLTVLAFCGANLIKFACNE